MTKILLLSLLLSVSFQGFSQVSIAPDRSLPDKSAMLDVKSTNKGFLMPRLSTAQRTAISAPANGLMVYDSTTSSFWVYKNGKGWNELIAADPSLFKTNGCNCGQNFEAKSWEKISDAVFPTGWRDGVASTIYKDTILVFGGWDGATYGDIYASANGGVTWSLYGSIPAPAHAITVIHAADDFYYLFGNDQLSTPTARKSVYRTKDFKNWELRTANAEWGDRMLSAAVEYKGALYVMGGQADLVATTGLGDVWKSTDGGSSWQKIADNLPFLAKNIYGQVASFEGRLWLVGGGKYDNDPLLRTFEKEVYSSEDGINWKREEDIPVGGKTYAKLIVWDGKLWLVNGSADSYNSKEVAYMNKNGKWTSFNTESGILTETHAATLVVWNDQLLRIAGNTTNDVWRLSRTGSLAVSKDVAGNWNAMQINSSFRDNEKKAIVWNDSLGKVGQVDVRYDANSGHTSMVFGNLLNAGKYDSADRLTLRGNGDGFLNGRLAIGATYFSGTEALKIYGDALVDGGYNLNLNTGSLQLKGNGRSVFFNQLSSQYSYITNNSVSGTNLTFVDNGAEAMKIAAGQTTLNTALQVNGPTVLNGAVTANVATATDADYQVTESDYMIILPATSQSRTLILPTTPTDKVRILILRSNTKSDPNKWNLSVPVKTDGADITTLPHTKTLTLYGTNGVWYTN